MDDDTTEPDLLEVDVSRERGVTVLAVSGELDAATAPELQDPLDEVLARDDIVLLDLTECGFVDSTGLHAIIDAREELLERGGRLAVSCRPRGPVARVIEVALPGVLELYPDRESALDAVSQ